MEKFTRREFSKIAGIGATSLALGGSLFIRPSEGFSRAYADDAVVYALDNSRDALLAVFTNCENDGTDTFYLSTDGVHFEKIGEAFVNLDPTDPNNVMAVGSGSPEYPVKTPNGWERTWPLYSFKCPSIVFHSGYFWMLSNEQNSGDDGTLRLVMSASNDLVHWCDQKQVKVEVPAGYQTNGTSGQFDVVAADWSVGNDGVLYAVASLGRYGAYHGHAEADFMEPYLVKITELAPTGIFDPINNPIGNDSSYITVRAERAQKIVLPDSSHDRIDGSLYFEGSLAYLSIKENGVTNEIWSISDLARVSNPTAWTLVNANVVTGYEAPCLTKFNGTYFMYTDELATWTPDDHVRQPYFSTGTFVQQSKSLVEGWSQPSRIDAYKQDYSRMTLGEPHNANADGPRHGTVILLTDPTAKAIAWNARTAAGWRADQKPSEPPAWFSDVDKDHWAFSAIYYCANRGLLSGYSGSYLFGPNDSLTRAQAAVVLWRYFEPKEAASYAEVQANTKNTTGMTDVEPAAWYTAAANWAVSKGIVNGYKGTTWFGPNDGMQREQLFAIVANAAKSLCGALYEGADPARMNAMPDHANVSPWAKEVVAWGLNNQVMNGWRDPSTDIRYIKPQDVIDRSTMAGVMMNAIENGVIFRNE